MTFRGLMRYLGMASLGRFLLPLPPCCFLVAQSCLFFLWPHRVATRFLCPWISQARILEWVAISFSRGSSGPRDWTHVSCMSYINRQILYHWATWEASAIANSTSIPCCSDPRAFHLKKPDSHKLHFVCSNLDLFFFLIHRKYYLKFYGFFSLSVSRIQRLC